MAEVVFIVAHQDDDTLSFGPAIANHVQARHEVFVVLATDGINSAVRDQLTLTRTRFARARDLEFVAAVNALGATPLVTRFGAEDGKFTLSRARTIVTDVIETMPAARVKTHSPLGLDFRHPDHVNLGLAARELYDDELIDDLRFYVEPYVRSRFEVDFPNAPLSAESAPDVTPVRVAIREYANNDPANDRYGIGYRSVPQHFDALETELTSFRHLP